MQHLAADLGARAQFAEPEAVPVDAAEPAAPAPLQPVWVGADRRSAHDQVGVTNRLGEYERRNLGQGKSRPRVQGAEPDLAADNVGRSSRRQLRRGRGGRDCRCH
ncbi:MAG: hypothetical protein WB608_06265 [Terracidiphilus sp.]